MSLSLGLIDASAVSTMQSNKFISRQQTISYSHKYHNQFSTEYLIHFVFENTTSLLFVPVVNVVAIVAPLDAVEPLEVVLQVTLHLFVLNGGQGGV